MVILSVPLSPTEVRAQWLRALVDLVGGEIDALNLATGHAVVRSATELSLSTLTSGYQWAVCRPGSANEALRLCAEWGVSRQVRESLVQTLIGQGTTILLPWLVEPDMYLVALFHRGELPAELLRSVITCHSAPKASGQIKWSGAFVRGEDFVGDILSRNDVRISDVRFVVGSPLQNVSDWREFCERFVIPEALLEGIEVVEVGDDADGATAQHISIVRTDNSQSAALLIGSGLNRGALGGVEIIAFGDVDERALSAFAKYHLDSIGRQSMCSALAAHLEELNGVSAAQIVLPCGHPDGFSSFVTSSDENRLLTLLSNAVDLDGNVIALV
jgi:hypothetical protein